MIKIILCLENWNARESKLTGVHVIAYYQSCWSCCHSLIGILWSVWETLLACPRVPSDQLRECDWSWRGGTAPWFVEHQQLCKNQWLRTKNCWPCIIIICCPFCLDSHEIMGFFFLNLRMDFKIGCIQDDSHIETVHICIIILLLFNLYTRSVC